MAASLPTLGERAGATAGEYVTMEHLQAAHTMHQFPGSQNSQQEVQCLQDVGPAMAHDTDDMQMWPSDSEAQADVSRMLTPYDLSVTDRDGSVPGGYNRGQAFDLEEHNPGRSQDPDRKHENDQQRGDHSSLGDDQRVILTFSEGEVDAVPITERDLEGLQPTKFLSNNIIDFYIRYLKEKLSPEDDKRYLFFNSFFFTKLLGNNSASTDIDGCEVNYEHVRNWSADVNIFDKDYIFIPIVRSSHWSLIIICNLSSLVASSPGKRKMSPCILHLDPIEGKHESFDGQIRSYLFQAWMDRYRDSNSTDEETLAEAFKMKYIRAKVPQQDNGYDCGIFLLHYVELFLRESTSPDFSFATSRGGPYFSSSWHAEEVSAKRKYIQSLIVELSENPNERAVRRLHIQPVPEPRDSDADCPTPKPDRSQKPPKGQNKSKKWSEAETTVLLKYMVEVGRVRKGSQGASHWWVISEEMKTKLGAIRSEVQCRLRCDTLLKAYKTMRGYMGKTGKSFSDISPEERIELKLATPLSEAWFKDLDKIYHGRKPDNTKSQKRVKFNPSDGNGLRSSSPRNSSPPQIPSGSSEAKKASPKQVAIPGFSTLDEDLRSTLLNLVQVSLIMRTSANFLCPSIESLKLDGVCQRLAIVQDRKVAEVRNSVIQLRELKLVNFEFISKLRYGTDFGKVPYLNLTGLRVYMKFLEKVLCKNPNFDTYLRIMAGNKDDSVSFPGALLPLSLRRIRVLRLVHCKEIEHIDLSNFPELRCLVMDECWSLKMVTGWESVKELGWLEIQGCRSYTEFPPIQWLPSLSEFRYTSLALGFHSDPGLHLFSQCVQLRRLEISSAYFMMTSSSIDLSTLRCLEVLSFRGLSALTSIHGLSGLQYSLTKLEVSSCGALKGVPELGCLKALTHLDLSESGIEEVQGVQELHLLTALNLNFCRPLTMLPWLGHLKALTFLGISWAVVEEIPGVEDLVSLKTLDCYSSRLKRLPELHRLPRSLTIDGRGTPLMDPSSSWYRNDLKVLSIESKEKVTCDNTISDVSDISDTE